MIKPTIGRIVHFFALGHDECTAPHAAIIADVGDDGRINIAFFDANGVPGNAIGVVLLQDEEIAPVGGEYCMWPPR